MPRQRQQAHHQPRTLITGATGFLGRNILFRLLERDKGTRFVLLVRGRGGQSPRDRLHKILSSRYTEDEVVEFKKRIDLAPGDVTWKHFGLDDRAYRSLAESVERVIHAAALVLFDFPLEQARNINVEGTRIVLDFAEEAAGQGVLRRVDYIGTAFVAGKRRGIILEDELDEGQAFNNTYEQTKMEAEKVVRERWGDLPITIHRPSIVVGESSTGKTSSFNVVYFPLKLYARGIWRWTPGTPDVPVDIVPVDFVCCAVDMLSRSDDTIGRCYHITASRNATTMGEASKLAQAYFGQKPVKFIRPVIYMNTIHPLAGMVTFGRLHDTLMNKGALYLPYFMSNMEFDNRQASAILGPQGAEAPQVKDYFARIFQFCIDTEWGKKAVEPED